MTLSNCILSSLALALLSSLACPAFAANEGTAIGVKPDASARIERVERTLIVGADLSVGETVVTGPKGQVQIIFDDETRLVVGPGSTLLLEAYLMRADHTAEQLTINALAGTFRFITGNSPKPAYQIKTPTASIGVRGTKFDLVVTRQATRVTLFEGALQMCNSGGSCADVSQRCDLGMATPAGTAVYAANSAEQRSLASDFYYVRFQSPLLSGFRVGGAGQCLEGPGGVVVPIPITEPTAANLPPPTTPPDNGGSPPDNGGPPPDTGPPPDNGSPGGNPPTRPTTPDDNGGSRPTGGGRHDRSPTGI